jgi:uncharacterized membrane protein YdjX (TVP38/TMEM64 family)
MNKSALRGVLALMLLAAIGLGWLFREQFDAAAVRDWVASAGAAAPLLFMAIYALATLLFLPGSLLTLLGGALFGPVWGTLWNLSGATLGAALAFVIARHLGAPWVERRAGPRLQRLSDGVAAEGWRFVAFVRLTPLFPFNLLNYALGLTRIPFWSYVLATGFFMLPGALAYTYLGYAGREAAAGGQDLIQKALLALALLAAVAFLPRLIAKLRERPMMDVAELRQRLENADELLLLDVRSEADFIGEQGRLAAARHISLERLPAQLDQLQPYLRRPIALISCTERRSAQAARILAEAGFSDVQVVRGGMTAWIDKGWPLDRQSLQKD